MIQLRLRETALLRQGLLSEPQASSGPAAMLLAVSRSPSSIPPTESLPGAMPPSSGVPQPHPPNETSNVSPTASNAKSRRQKNLSHRHETPAFSFPGLP